MAFRRRSSITFLAILLAYPLSFFLIKELFWKVEAVDAFSPSSDGVTTGIRKSTSYNNDLSPISFSQPQLVDLKKDDLVTSYPDGDSLEKFSRDVKKVVKELHLKDEDSAIPALYRSRKPCFTTIWDMDDWTVHTSRWRYVRYAMDFPTSRTLRRTIPQMLVLFAWSCIAVTMGVRDVLVGRVHIALTPLSLVSTFVAALLTLRSNQGLSRLVEARTAFAKIVEYTREMAQLIGTNVYPQDQQLGLLAARHVTIFGWCLRAHIRGSPDMVNDVVSTMLPSHRDAQYIAAYGRKPPAAVILRLLHIIDHMTKRGKVDKEVQKCLIATTIKLNQALMVTEKIRNSPIPPLYTAHTSRLLMFYLFWLPLALYGTLKHCFVTILVTLAAGYAMLGLDEISHILENPFQFMPLQQLSKISMIDAADAIIYRPPPLFCNDVGGSSKSEQQHSTMMETPEYW